MAAALPVRGRDIYRLPAVHDTLDFLPLRTDNNPGTAESVVCMRNNRTHFTRVSKVYAGLLVCTTAVKQDGTNPVSSENSMGHAV